ncbi:MAG TPA: type II toxin-antitoxin system VapC family toxin [Vicinamibacterales bacterium]|jgi:predicted nucleic-acid-binding protein|nr:type II toxin-antitoxin system VapC family toxin [Vicinamibacterales bacterium]
MRAVDTNVIVRLIVRDDAKQVAAAEAFIEHGVWISTLALAEAVWVLSTTYEHHAAELAAGVEMLLNNSRVTLQDADVVAGALGVYRSRPALGFSDCLILELARKAGHLPLGTFDRNLAKLEGTERL